MPLVSVCIPTYKGDKHLAAAIESVLSQTFQDFELIIVDDNSPDETASIVAAYDDPRIRYLRNPKNLGPEGNWNRCLQEAKGKYFKLLPQDDSIYPKTLERQIKVLAQDDNDEIALVFGSRNIIDTNGKIITRRGYPGGKEGLLTGSVLIRKCVRRGTNLIGEPGSVLLRKSLTDRIGVFNGDIPYVIDLDYWVRALNHGDGYYIIDAVSSFRVSPGSWSVAIGRGQGSEYTRFIDKIAQKSHIKFTKFDTLLGKTMAMRNNLLRLLFYKFIGMKSKS